MSSGLTHWSNCSDVNTPSAIAASFSVVPSACAFFATLAGANRYAVIYRVSTAKRLETRQKTIARFVAMLERGEMLH